jgi:hypothetical protein
MTTSGGLICYEILTYTFEGWSMYTPNAMTSIGLCAGFDENVPFANTAALTGRMLASGDQSCCERYPAADGRLYEYWEVSRNPDLLKGIERLANEADEDTFIRFVGAAKLDNGDYLVAYESVSDFTSNVFTGDDCVASAALIANLLITTVRHVRIANGQWIPFTDGKLNLALDKNQCPVLTRRQPLQRATDSQLQRDLTFIKEFFVSELCADEDTVAGYIRGDAETVARVRRAAAYAPAPARAPPANCERRNAITTFWASSGTNRPSLLMQCVERLTAPADRGCLDAFLATPVNGLYPHTAVLRAELRAGGPIGESATVFKSLGADMFAFEGAAMSAPSMIIAYPGTTYETITRWCRDCGIAELKKSTECHPHILAGAIFHENAINLLDFFTLEVGFDLGAIRMNGETVLHRLARIKPTGATCELARRVVKHAPQLLTTEVAAPAFWPVRTVTPAALATGEMKTLLLAEQQRNDAANAQQCRNVASSGTADPSAAALHDLLEQLRVLIAQITTRSGNTV